MAQRELADRTLTLARVAGILYLILIACGLSSELLVRAAHYLALHSYGYDLGLIFFAISLLCLGYLLATSSYLPRWLGVGLLLSGLVYLTGSMTRFVIPDYYPALQPLYLLPLATELAVALWLIIRGIRPADREALEGRSLG